MHACYVHGQCIWVQICTLCLIWCLFKQESMLAVECKVSIYVYPTSMLVLYMTREYET